MAKESQTIVTGKDFLDEGMPEEAKFAFQYRTHSAVPTITMAVRGHGLGSTAHTNDTSELCNQLGARYAETAEANIDALYTGYLLVSLKVGESVTKYVEHVGTLENDLVLFEIRLVMTIGSLSCYEDFP